LKTPKAHWINWLIAVGLFVYFLGRFVNILADYDLWGYLAFGRLFWENGFPYRDLFSYVPTKVTWVYHEWLTGVIFFPIYENLGAAGLQLLRYAMIMSTIAIMAIVAVRRGANSLSTAIILFLAVNGLTYGYAPVRAQIFTYFFFALFIYILECYRQERNPRILWLLPAAQIVWCNTHGGFVAGLGLIGLYAIGEGIARRQYLPYLKALLLSLPATLINPYGIDYWTYIVQAVAMPRPDITEWMSLYTAVTTGRFRDESFLFIALVLITIFLIVRSRKKNLTDILVLAATAYLAFKSIRHIILFFLAFGTYVPVMLSEYTDAFGKDPKIIPILKRIVRPAAILSCAVLVLLASLSLRHFIYSPSLDLKTPPYSYPVQALAWIGSHSWQGNILPNFEWGEFVMWRCYPKCRVSMDGRLETVYEDSLQKEYFDFLHGRTGWQIFLQKYPHDMILIKRGSRTDSLMRDQQDWRLAYEDGLSVIFLRNQERTSR
jgi:hypothetical protein